MRSTPVRSGGKPRSSRRNLRLQIENGDDTRHARSARRLSPAIGTYRESPIRGWRGGIHASAGGGDRWGHSRRPARRLREPGRHQGRDREPARHAGVDRRDREGGERARSPTGGRDLRHGPARLLRRHRAGTRKEREASFSCSTPTARSGRSSPWGPRSRSTAWRLRRTVTWSPAARIRTRSSRAGRRMGRSSGTTLGPGRERLRCGLVPCGCFRLPHPGIRRQGGSRRRVAVRRS